MPFQMINASSKRYSSLETVVKNRDWSPSFSSLITQQLLKRTQPSPNRKNSSSGRNDSTELVRTWNAKLTRGAVGQSSVLVAGMDAAVTMKLSRPCTSNGELAEEPSVHIVSVAANLPYACLG